MGKETILEVDGVNLNFGGAKVLVDVSFCAETNEILAMIGPNGAGKTCLLNCISGFYRPNKGAVRYRGININKLPSHKIATLGIARTFQNIALYSELTTLENLMAARHIKMKQNILVGAIFFGFARSEEIKHREVIERIIDFLEIQAVRNKVVGSLPYGVRKRIELGRALALEPSLLLLDEPMAGMNVEEKEDMARFIIDIRETQGIPILIVEHDIGLVVDISDRVIVLDFGVKVAEGSASEIVKNPKVIDAYLGAEGN